MCNDVVEWWIFDFVQWRGYRNWRRFVAQFQGGYRGSCEFRSWIHAVARVSRQILVTEGGKGGRCRRKADTIVQTAATIAESHGYPVDASLPPWREGRAWDRDSRGISWWVDWLLKFSSFSPPVDHSGHSGFKLIDSPFESRTIYARKLKSVVLFGANRSASSPTMSIDSTFPR